MKQNSDDINKFIGTLFPINIDNLDKEKAKLMRLEIVPKTIFKYRNFDDENHFESLKNDNIWLSDPREFEDTNECTSTIDVNEMINENIDEFLDSPFIGLFLNDDKKQMILKSNNPANELIDFLSTKTELSKEQLEEEFRNNFNNDIKDNLKICSFSAIKDSKQMWEIYGHNNSGYCVEYETEDLEIYPVVYDDDIIDITTYAKLPKDKQNNLYLLLSVLTKNKKYNFEDEYRLVVQTNLEKNSKYIDDGNYQVGKPKAVYMGTDRIVHQIR
jgi:hypothetical protein